MFCAETPSAPTVVGASVTQPLKIAGQFGYDNGSKFAKAFRGIIGVTPNAYRAGVSLERLAVAG